MPDPVLWPYTPGGEFSERLESLTDLLSAKTGPGQHRRGRIAPRTVLGFEALESGRRRRRMEQALVANGSGTWRVPLWADAALLSAGIGGSLSTTVDAEILDRRFRIGEMAMLVGDDPEAAQVVEIAEVNDYTLELTEPPGTWPAGATIVPLATGRLDQVPPLSRFTADAAPVDLAFRLTDPLDWPEDVGDALYRGLPVLEYQPDWSSDPTFQPERQLDLVDGGSGLVTVYDYPGVPLGLTTLQLTLQGRAEIGAFRSLLYALGGRWGLLWAPTFAQDFKVTAPLVAASSTLDVEACGFSDWDLSPNRRDIRIELANGTVLYRRITAAADIGGDQERLTLNAALGVNAAANTVQAVSFLMLSRQDTDVNLLRYWSADVVSTEMRIRGVLDSDL